MATYAISDLHGQYEIFEKLLEHIGFGENDYMYVLGDAIDRGPDGIKILLRIMYEPNMDLLLGNHEFMMLNSVDLDGLVDDTPGKDADLWLYYNGGNNTFAQYKELSDTKRKELLDWLYSRKLTTLLDIGGRNVCLTHSSFIEDCIDLRYEDCTYEDVWNIVWRTPYRSDLFIPFSDYTLAGYDFVIGHVPVQKVVGIVKPLKPLRQDHILLIDGGCSFRLDRVLDEDEYGVICIRLDDMKEIVFPFSEI